MKNIIFDFGAVLVDWNPHYVYDSYFGSKEKTEFFIKNICPIEWNGEVDKGKPIAIATQERINMFPEWEKEIKMYFDRWIDMIGDPIPGMVPLIKELKSKGYKLYGLSNWARETFSLVEHRFEAFGLLDGYIISGDVKMLKPAAEIYQTLLSRFNLVAEESVFVDDNINNVIAAEKLGIKGIHFVSAEDLKEKLKLVY